MKKILLVLFLAGFILNTSAVVAKTRRDRSTPTPSPTLWPTSTTTPSPTITPSPTLTLTPSPSPTLSLAQLTANSKPKVLVSGTDLFLAALILLGLLYVGFLVREKLIVSVERKLTKLQKKRRR